MSRHGAVIGAATAVLALFALVAMHGVPFAGAAPAVADHAMGDAAPAHDHAMGDAPASQVAATSDDAGSTAPHAHSVWHLCLAVLVALAGLALAASVGRRITDLIPRMFGRLVRVLESRTLDPPSQAGLCLLRC